MKLKIKQIRRDNLEALIAEAGSASELARRASTNSSYLSQLRNQLPTQKGTPRSIGDELANKLEKAMHKIQGWMDIPHNKDWAMGNDSDAQHQCYELRNLLPLIAWHEAGDWQEKSSLPKSLYGKELFPSLVSCSPQAFVLRVQGNSMEPRFHEGDLIFLEPNRQAVSGQFVAVKLGGARDVTFRQLIIEEGQRYLMALNPDWPERIIRMEDDARICGVVIFRGEVF